MNNKDLGYELYEKLESNFEDVPYYERPFKASYQMFKFLDNNLLVAKVEVGGIEGGSCWEDSNPQNYICSFDELEFCRCVHKILKENLNKTFEFMEIETDSSVEKEYYGNETYYKILTFSLKEVEY